MRTSAYLRSKYAPASGEPLGLTKPRGNFVELAVPMSPVPGGAGNGTSAYLLRKYAPALGACRRLRLLATNASRLLYAHTLAGSSPGTLLKKHGTVMVPCLCF